MNMTTYLLFALGAGAAATIICCVVIATLHREPAGHGRHAGRRVLLADDVIEYAKVDGSPPWEVHHHRKSLPALAVPGTAVANVQRGEPDSLDRLVAAASRGWLAGALTLPATPGQRAGYWQPRDPASVLHPRVLAALERAGGEDTVVRMSDLEPMIGGDPYNGGGQAGYLAAFDRITDRAHAQIARARLTLAQIAQVA